MAMSVKGNKWNSLTLIKELVQVVVLWNTEKHHNYDISVLIIHKRRTHDGKNASSPLLMALDFKGCIIYAEKVKIIFVTLVESLIVDANSQTLEKRSQQTTEVIGQGCSNWYGNKDRGKG